MKIRILGNTIRIWMLVFSLTAIMHLPAFSADTIKIAGIFSQTGIAGIHNAPLIQMLELAVEELNRNGGLLNRPVTLILLDNKSTPIDSTLAAEAAVRQNVTAVIGAHWSSHSLAIAPVLQKAKIPMISPGSTNPKVTRIGDYIFRVCFIDSFQGRAMARFAYTHLNARTAVILKNIDEAYCLMLAQYFGRSFQHIKGKVLLDEGYRGKAVDFSDILTKVIQLKPDVVYIPGYTRDSGLLIRQAVSMGIKTTFLGGDAWDEIYEYAGDAIEGSYNSAPCHPAVPLARSIHLNKIYKEKVGKPISNVSAPLAYDAFMLLADAIERAGTLDKRKIRDALASTRGFPGATGVITLDKSGDPQDKGVIILKWENGHAKYYQAIKP